jgi:hypothetical protein
MDGLLSRPTVQKADPMRRPANVVLVLSLLATSAVGCRSASYPEGTYPCAAATDCPPAWFCHADRLCWSAPEEDAGLRDAALDAASFDAATTDAATNDACTRTIEMCNGLDDDCNGMTDDGPAVLSCAGVLHGGAGCSGGSCYAAKCEPGYADCNHQFDDGCEAELATDIANCGTCGNACGWDCDASTCNDAVDVGVNVSYAATCVLRESGDVVCWGENGYGQLGDGTTDSRTTPAPVVGLTGVVAVSTGGVQTCAVTSSGAVWCWGANAVGALGDGTGMSSSVPVRVSGISTASDVTCGVEHSCALLLDATVQCWGDGIQGSLGDAMLEDSLVPVRVFGLTSVRSLGSGRRHVCAARTDGTGRCWGLSSASGPLGDGITVTRSDTPVTVTGLTTATEVTAGYQHSCALTDVGPRCWGANDSGQIGDGTRAPRPTPTTVPVAGCTGVALVAGGPFSCVACEEGPLYCWGNGTLSPTLVPGVSSVSRLAAGANGVCAIDVHGGLFCGVPPDLLPAPRP